MTKKPTTTTRKQPGRYSVQFKDQRIHDSLVAMAETRGLCVATLIRLYTMEGLTVDERKYDVRQ